MMADFIPPGITDPLGHSDARGLVASTASITPQLLMAAYSHGVFPWTDNPVGWFCPLWRGVIVPEHAHFPRNLGRLRRRGRFTVRLDGAFDAVVAACAAAHRHDGVWITPRYARAYGHLHRLGVAHSVEVWQDDTLVGGLYGVQVGRVFCAESMFALVANAGKVAVQGLVERQSLLGIRLIDVQVVGDTTAALGAAHVPRAVYLRWLHTLRAPSRAGSWQHRQSDAAAPDSPSTIT